MKLQSQRRFQEQILRVMDRKHHWAWPYFSSDALSKAQLKIHFQQEYAVYVRDFPVFLRAFMDRIHQPKRGGCWLKISMKRIRVAYRLATRIRNCL